MGELSSLPNISKVIEEKLHKADILTKEQLAALGSKEAFIRILLQEPDACINMLYALEGALHNIRWHTLPQSKKDELKEFYNSLRL